jgi:RHS repeat-associated protein
MAGGYDTYVNKVAYTELGDAEQYDLGEAKTMVIQQAFEDGTRRLKQSFAASGPTISSNRNYSYDPAGNVLKDDNIVGPDVQCFDYDAHRRLAAAWTPSSGDCAAAPTAGGLGGAAPYWQSWAYLPNGLRKTETNHASAGDTTATYTYDAARPHAVSKVVTTGTAPRPDATYTYDPAGNTATRPGTTGGQQALSWDAEGKLSKLSAQSGDTNYIYDADGSLLLRKSPSRTTLFVGSLEVTVETTSGAKVVSAQRHYSIGGKDIAVRSTVDKLDWLIGDNHNTSQLTLDKTTHTPTTRYTTPFGAPRGPTAASWPDTHGFLGKPEDKNTGLTHVGAREYDPAIGRFLSVDPVLDPADPQSLLAYTYANNNPTTMSDPDGLCPLYEGERGCGSHPTPTPTPPPSNVGTKPKDRPTPSSSNSNSNSNGSGQDAGVSSGWDGRSRDRQGGGDPVARPHPDRMFEMAGCNGGPGCVMPEGFVGKYGPYRPLPGEELFGELLLMALFSWTPAPEVALIARGSRLLTGGRALGATGKVAAAAQVAKVLGSKASIEALAGGKQWAYRGLKPSHPGFDEALRGAATPRKLDGTMTQEAHNAGEALKDSQYLSWTRSPDVARMYAGPDGVVLRIPRGEGGPYKFDWSPDDFGEDEILLDALVRGADVFR